MGSFDLNARRNREHGENVGKALGLITQYGGFDGEHHKQWLLDQLVRELTSSPAGSATEYEKWVAEFKDGEDGPNTYEWDDGCPP